ncbi:hypothetical protein SLS58_008111 [Diplodia intermedia]|uniref:Protein kinase domain-containing protein n=1 Tax=Diplodia intermedia TaxID=856260 RepID=A0ABR3TIC0_9PEZI
MAGRLPGHHKGRFEAAHLAHVQRERPQWNASKSAAIEELSHQEEKWCYDGKHETPFKWRIPIHVPPIVKNTKKSIQDREDFLNDPANYDISSEEDGEENAGEEGAVAESAGEEGAGAEGEGEEGAGDEGAEEEGAVEGAPVEEGPIAGDSDELPSAPDPAQASRIKDLEAQVTQLRKDNAYLGSHVSQRRHWPNLAHMPLPPSTDDGNDDPTGHLREKWQFQFQRLIQRRPGRQERNYDEAVLQETANYERMTKGEIEGRDGKEVLNHEEGTWEFHRMLGKGGFGRVALWRKMEFGRVKDMVAVKEEESGTGTWTDPYNWRDGLPREISIQEHLKKINPPCPYLISSRGYRLNLRQRRWRLYLPYLPGQTLHHPIDFAERWHPDITMPVDFVFYAFLAMAEACLALDCGWWGGEENEPPVEEMQNTQGRKAGWIPIVHRDIKPGNTFMDREEHDEHDGGERFYMYPTPCIGDMGMAFEAYPDDPYNPEAYIPGGTPTFMAPEQLAHRPIGVPFARKLSDRTNVFAIAVTIFALWLGKMPGFLASKQAAESVVGEDDSHLPPNRSKIDFEGLLVEHYEDDPPRDHEVPMAEIREFIGQELDELSRKTLGAPGTSYWVNLWELEKWKSQWLLRSKPVKKWQEESPRGWIVSDSEVQPLEGNKETKLASILRQCLEWDADERPSILKLRDMVKDAIRELDIRPSGYDDRLDGGDMFPPASNRGGLIYPMDNSNGSVDYGKRVGDRILDDYRVDRRLGLFEMARRSMMEKLRPAQSNDELGTEGVYG